MRLKGIDNFVKQTIVEYLKIPIWYDKNTFYIGIAFLQPVNDCCTFVIKTTLSAVQKDLDPVLYRLYNCFFNFRFFDLVTISVADEKSGLIFVCHKNFCIKKAQQHINVSYAKKHAAH